MAGQILIVGTTKTPQLTSVLDRLATEFKTSAESEPVNYPTEFKFCNREQFPFVTPFTCVCNPDFGSGYQHGDICSYTNTEIQGFISGKSILPVVENAQDNIPCSMFISSITLAAETNQKIESLYGKRENLVNKLVELNYYS